MNLIWMLPVIFIMIKIFPELYKQKRYIYIIFFIIGYLLLAIPDNLLWTKDLLIIHNIFASRFVISEFIILVCLLYYLIKKNIILK
jgi:hypothetical protein